MPAKKSVSRATKKMADGFNEPRAMRIAEVMNDYHLTQHQIAQSFVNPSAAEYYEQGFEILRQCQAEAQAVLIAPFIHGLPQAQAQGGAEEQRQQLQRILLDASVRRFRSHKILLRALAAVRWVNARNNILQGQNQHASHAVALQQIDYALGLELAAITDQRVFDELRAQDLHARHWLQEDPTLPVLLQWMNTHQ